MNTICINKRVRLFFIICFILIFPIHASAVDLDVRVSNGNDDAEERVSNGDMSLGSSDLEMVWDGYEQIIGIRFRNVTIPVGAVITSAKITFRADGSESNATSLIIHGEDEDDCLVFSSTDDDISDRTKTTASVSWNNVAPWNNNSYYDSPDLTSIVQEIVSRGGWGSGNAMTFIISNNGASSGQRRADTYNETTTRAPLLHVEYTVVATPFIQLSETALTPTCLVGNDPAADTFVITNSGTADLEYTITDDVAWLSVAPASATVAGGGTDMITVTYVANTLAVGTYDGVITITDPDAPNSPVDINVTLSVQNETFEVSVSADTDDAEENDSGGMDLYSTDLELVTEDTDQIIGVRFDNITIPSGVLITNAYIEFDVDENENTNPTNLDIHAQAADNASTFSNNSSDISSRVTTNQFVLNSVQLSDFINN